MISKNVRIFGGLPHFPAEMAENGSFQNAWTEFFQSPDFIETANKLTAQKLPITALGVIQFGSEKFIQWIGLDLTQCPKVRPDKWLSLELPAGSGVEAKEANLGWQILPVEFSLQLVYNAADKEQVVLPKMLGHSDKPYFIEEIEISADLAQVKEHRYFIYQGIEEEIFED
ncbi:hypothetical protein [Xylocopilactobacillus apicola]|uniref:Uncharacterized protein n=1 Tax=Xylocopilactobacillus apicola TaxID=2932184 RepID=A0AAU9DF93_9LACO|nr:hypothetical protein [Xylocopilactobacillus apicola]BDR59597.1 hypothetical protein XA3_20380 [Xylocopilactobacillus apicola]